MNVTKWVSLIRGVNEWSYKIILKKSRFSINMKNSESSQFSSKGFYERLLKSYVQFLKKSVVTNEIGHHKW